MRAEEARKIADNVKSSELDNVLSSIQMAAKNGEYEVHLYSYLNEITVKRLKKLGYRHTSSFDRNEILVTISW